MYNRLQYITNSYEHMQAALDAGCAWIQLRCKDIPEKDYCTLAVRSKLLCERYKATFIVNDSVAVAQYAGADGVHLGLEDESIRVARKVLGPQKIIGGTANTLVHLHRRVAEGCNYIGLGPFRFTITKQRLSPILGLEGYQSLLAAMDCPLPVYAIGGITAADVPALLQAGVHGVAVSGVITAAVDRQHIVSQFNQMLYGSFANSR